MELDEMKLLWDKMSSEVEKQKKLTTKLIMEMTHVRYKKRLQAISIPESIGTIICIAMAIFMMVNFRKLDTWYLQASGIFSIIFLITLPIFSLLSIYNMHRIDITKMDYKQTLAEYAKRKQQFWLVQRAGFYLSFVFLLMILPLLTKIMKGQDLFINNTIWYWYVPGGILFLLLFTAWVYKNYKKATTGAGNILKELEE